MRAAVLHWARLCVVQFECRCLLLVVVAMSLSGCFRSEVEVARVANPTGDVEGVVVETNGGATTSFGHEIHVVPAGGRAGDYSLIAVINGATRRGTYGVDLVWRTPTLLAVQYMDARGSRLIVPQLRVGSKTITVALREGEPRR